MAVSGKSNQSQSRIDYENNNQLNEAGVFPEELNQFVQVFPEELSEGDFFAGSRLREDMKEFVYSGLISEFPTRSEDTLYVVTERGDKAVDELNYFLNDSKPSLELENLAEIEKAYNTDFWLPAGDNELNPDMHYEVVQADPEFNMSDTYKIIETSFPEQNRLRAVEEVMRSSRIQKEMRAYQKGLSREEGYQEFGEDIVEAWENISETLRDSSISNEYQEIVIPMVEGMEGHLIGMEQGSTEAYQHLLNTVTNTENASFRASY